MASNSGFDITVPSGTSAVSDGDNDLRQIKTFQKNWWEQEHYATDGSSNSAGVHKPGSARIYTQASAPTAVNIGELWHDPDDDALYVAEAAGTGDWQVVTTALVGLTAKATINVGVVAAGAANTSHTITVTGATAGSPVIVGHAGIINALWVVRAIVEADDTVRMIFSNFNTVSGDAVSQEYAVTVFNK